MHIRITAMVTCALLLMLVIPVCGSPATTDNDLEINIFGGRLFKGPVGIGVTMEATNNGEEPVNASFVFLPICLRIGLPWNEVQIITKVVQPHQTLKETFFFPPLSFGAVMTSASIGEYLDTYKYMDRNGFHVGQLVFLNPIIEH